MFSADVPPESMRTCKSLTLTLGAEQPVGWLKDSRAVGFFSWAPRGCSPVFWCSVLWMRGQVLVCLLSLLSKWLSLDAWRYSWCPWDPGICPGTPRWVPAGLRSFFRSVELLALPFL